MTKFESELQNSENMDLQSLEILHRRRLYAGGQVCAPAYKRL